MHTFCSHLLRFTTLALTLSTAFGCSGSDALGTDEPADGGRISNDGGARSHDAGRPGPLEGVPEIHFEGPLAPVAAGDTAARLHWTAHRAQTCYGVAGPAGVTDWAREWPASTTASDGFLVGNLARHPTEPTSYHFTLRCYGETDAIDGEPVVAYREATHTVVLAHAESGGGSSCDAYLASLSPSERAHFYAYRAESRGFERVTRSFVEHTGNTLGIHSGMMGAGAVPVIPGQIADTEYLSLTFSLPASDAVNSGKFAMNLQTVSAHIPILDHNLIVTISPCPGDFRPRGDSDDEDEYLRNVCRTRYAMSDSIRGGVDDPTRCHIPADQTMYMNVALRDLYTAPGEPIPDDLCDSTTTYCGRGALISK